MRTSIWKLSAVVLAFGLVSCEGEDFLGSEGEVEQRLSEYLLTAESMASNLYNFVDAARRDSSYILNDSTQVGGGAIVRNINDTLVIDFTAAGTYGTDGKLRKGVVRCYESGNYLMVNGNIAASLIDYSVDDVSVEGYMVLRNEGNDSVSLNISGFRVNDQYVLNSTKGLKWLAGFSTLQNLDDDRYKLGGTTSVSEVGTQNMVSVTFTEALIFDRQCQYGVESGIMDLTLAGDTTVTYTSGSIDFMKSDGCNNTVDLTISGDGRTLNFIKTFEGF